MPGRIGLPKPRYRVPGKGQPVYLTGAEAEAARAAERARNAATAIRDRPTPAQILDGKPVKPKSKPRAKPAPAGPAVVSAPAARAPTMSAAPAAAVAPSAAAPSGYVGLTPQQLAAQARAQVAAILGPQTAATNVAYQNQGAGLNAAYGAVAQMQEGIAPAIQGTYDAASARQAVIAKGFSDGFKMAADKSASGLNALLDPGSPQTITSAGEPGANVLFGLGGALPAGDLNAQGAAFASAAKYLPVQSKQLGLDSLKASELGRVQAVRELEAQRPKLMQDALAGLTTAEARRQQLDLEREMFEIKETRAQTDSDRDYMIDVAKLDQTERKLQQQGQKNSRVSPAKYADGLRRAGEEARWLYGGKESANGTVEIPPAESYTDALTHLMTTYSIKLADAQKLLAYWNAGEAGKPFINFQQRQMLRRRGATNKQIQAAIMDGRLSAQLLSRYGVK